MQASLLYDKDTGHVLALATTVAAAAAPPPDDPQALAAAVRALAGGTLPTRGYLDFATGAYQPTGFFVPAERLGLLSTEIEADVLLAPRKYLVRDHESLEMSPSTPLPQLDPVGQDALKLTLAQETPEELAVWLQVVPDAGVAGQPQSASGSFRPASATKKELTLSLATPLASGAHAVLVLVRGLRSAIQRINVP